MRHSYLVCYDIRHPKRLRRVHKICKGFGEPWQFSIFFCTLKPIDRVRLQVELEEVMNLKEDQVLIIDLGQSEAAAREAAVALGQGMDEPLEGMVVI
jgi:CRISPR-associated protein Cas2